MKTIELSEALLKTLDPIGLNNYKLEMEQQFEVELKYKYNTRLTRKRLAAVSMTIVSKRDMLKG